MWKIDPRRLLLDERDRARASPYTRTAVPYCIERIHQAYSCELCVSCQTGRTTVWDDDGKIARAFCDGCLTMLQAKPEYRCSGCGRIRPLDKTGRARPCPQCMGPRSVRRLPGQKGRPLSQLAPRYALRLFEKHGHRLCRHCRRGANIRYGGDKIEQLICLSCAKILSGLPAFKCKQCGCPKFVQKNGYVPPLCAKCHRRNRSIIADTAITA